MYADRPSMGRSLGEPLTSEPGLSGHFANFLLSLVGAELPLTETQQIFLIEMLGVCVVVFALVLLLMTVVGLGSICEDIFSLLRLDWCFNGGASRKGTFVVLDEHTDVEQATLATLAAAELVDGTPRVYAPEVECMPLGGGSGAAAAAAAARSSSGPSPFAPMHAQRVRELGGGDAGGEGTRQPSAFASPHLSMPAQMASLQIQPGASGGAATDRAHRLACASPASSRPASHRGAASPTRSALSARASSPGPVDYRDTVGWRDKDNPAWYGV